ncbi:MAG TPA: hypothetical protein VMN82_15005 [Thermoanaerobaculia bacterium]|nr:hypothetical protein [Thermoanaerobaculia bacterium]
MTRRDLDGGNWDPRQWRRVREFGWFRQHEAELIAEARRKRLEAENQRRAEAIRSRRYECPNCHRMATLHSLGEVDFGRCDACGWIFVDRVGLERRLSDARPAADRSPASNA